MTEEPVQDRHLSLLDEAISAARSASRALKLRDPDTMDLALSRSRGCVQELMDSLNWDESPDLAELLMGLFQFAYRNLGLADVEESQERIDDALRILEMHRESWLAVLEKMLTGSQEHDALSIHFA